MMNDEWWMMNDEWWIIFHIFGKYYNNNNKQVLLNSKYSERADVYSFGISKYFIVVIIKNLLCIYFLMSPLFSLLSISVLWEFLTAEEPFHGMIIFIDGYIYISIFHSHSLIPLAFFFQLFNCISINIW